MEGNNKAMRDALEYLCSISDLDLSELEALGNRLEDTSTYGGGLVLKLVHGVRNGQKALSAPQRNCDVYSVEEQHEKFLKFCAIQDCKVKCPLSKSKDMYECVLNWAQMPYDENESEAK